MKGILLCSWGLLHKPQLDALFRTMHYFRNVYHFKTFYIVTIFLNLQFKMSHKNNTKLHDLYSTNDLLIIWPLSVANIGIVHVRTYFYFGRRPFGEVQLGDRKEYERISFI